MPYCPEVGKHSRVDRCRWFETVVLRRPSESRPTCRVGSRTSIARRNRPGRRPRMGGRHPWIGSVCSSTEEAWRFSRQPSANPKTRAPDLLSVVRGNHQQCLEETSLLAAAPARNIKSALKMRPMRSKAATNGPIFVARMSHSFLKPLVEPCRSQSGVCGRGVRGYVDFANGVSPRADIGTEFLQRLARPLAKFCKGKSGLRRGIEAFRSDCSFRDGPVSVISGHQQI